MGVEESCQMCVGVMRVIQTILPVYRLVMFFHSIVLSFGKLVHVRDAIEKDSRLSLVC